MRHIGALRAASHRRMVRKVCDKRVAVAPGPEARTHNQGPLTPTRAAAIAWVSTWRLFQCAEAYFRFQPELQFRAAAASSRRRSLVSSHLHRLASLSSCLLRILHCATELFWYSTDTHTTHLSHPTAQRLGAGRARLESNILSRRSPSKRRRYRQHNLIIGSVFVLMVGALALSVWSGASPNNGRNVGTDEIAGVNSADVNNPVLVARGREVYTAYCAVCHGANLEGQPNWQREFPGGGRPAPPLGLTGRAWQHPDQLLFEITKYGGQANSPPGYINNMPSFENTLSDEEIWASLAYIKSTWPPEIQAAQQETNQQAR